MIHNLAAWIGIAKFCALLFRIDPETAHHLAINAIARGLIRGKLLTDPRLRVNCFGVDFPNPLGLAAGVDKNCIAVARWAGMGFGFAELGTITHLPQPGNPRPRVFRFPEQKAIVNRIGFSNDGSEIIAQKLAKTRSEIPLGINIGKSKVTPAENAAADYAASYQLLKRFGQYVMINVSSPNTPGLRGLQNKDALGEIVSAIREIPGPHPPLLVKISPDMHQADLEGVVKFVLDHDLQGISASNTTIDRALLPEASGVEGGISGLPVQARSEEVLKQIREISAHLPVIGVGGIFTGQDLYRRMQMGANLCQAYTGWVYGGPKMPARVLMEYLDLLDQK